MTGTTPMKTLVQLLQKLLEDLEDESGIETSSTDINILLLGPTGVGKTTFINAFANYLISNTLDEAIEVPPEVVIPAWFTYTDRETYEQKTITLGEPDDCEVKGSIGQSCTRVSRSFVFLANGKRLRLIDTPGIGDTSGPLQDEKNLEDMLAFINQFDHLNGICILLKPDENRKTPTFRFHIKELLRRLHTNARENLIFVFTHTRSTFYRPGDSGTLVRSLLDDFTKEYNISIPFNIKTAPCFDNQSFRFLALCHNGILCSEEEKLAYSKSWQHSFEQTDLLVEQILKCKPHKVHETVSLNHIQHTIRKLSRPVAEVARLIEQNKKMAEDLKNGGNVDKNCQKSLVVPQLDIDVIPLNYPRTVCINKKHTKVLMVNGLRKIDYTSHCHPHCYLDGVEEELVGDPQLTNCDAMDDSSGICKVCKFSWKEHMHITYEIEQSKTEFELKGPKYDQLSNPEKLEQFVKDLESEQSVIISVCAKLMEFLSVNSLNPVHDALFEYIDICLNEEYEKRQSGGENDGVVFGLERLKFEYQFLKDQMHETKLLRIPLSADPHSATLEEMNNLIESLYKLPYNGAKMKLQMERLKKNQRRFSRAREKVIDLSSKIEQSVLLKKLSKWSVET